jgi:hypothetical protein
MPTYASGLSGQVGAVAEVAYGTPVVVTHFYEFLSENFVFNPTWLDGQGLKAGQAFNRSSRTVVSQKDVNGDLTMEHTSGEAANAVADSMGFWWKYSLGSSLVTPSAFTAPSGAAAAAVGSGGTFAAGTYFWKITAIYPGGESGPSSEISATIVLNGSANLTWSALPAGATGAKVYRGTVTNTENVLVTTTGVVTSFTDTGAAGTAAAVPGVTAFKQIHTNGSKAGQFLTCQVGRPQISGVTVQPFTYTGVKVTDWEFSCNDNQIAQLKVTTDGRDEGTATGLAAASYPTPNGLFAFSHASVMTIGGTASTTAGETVIAGGSTLGSAVTGVVITETTPMKVDRYGLGNQGLKNEPIENAIPTITGTLTTEFFSRTELYDVFKTASTVPLQIDFTKFDSAGLDANGVSAGATPYRLSLILPAVKFKTAAVNINGPDVIPQSIGFQAYDDGSGSNPVIQIKIISKESSAI